MLRGKNWETREGEILASLPPILHRVNLINENKSLFDVYVNVKGGN